MKRDCLILCTTPFSTMRYDPEDYPRRYCTAFDRDVFSSHRLVHNFSPLIDTSKLSLLVEVAAHWDLLLIRVFFCLALVYPFSPV